MMARHFFLSVSVFCCVALLWLVPLSIADDVKTECMKRLLSKVPQVSMGMPKCCGRVLKCHCYPSVCRTNPHMDGCADQQVYNDNCGDEYKNKCLKTIEQFNSECQNVDVDILTDKEPDSTVQPDPTKQPSSTVHPDSTMKPSPTVQPSPTMQTSSTLHQDSTMQPDSTVKPSTTQHLSSPVQTDSIVDPNSTLHPSSVVHQESTVQPSSQVPRDMSVNVSLRLSTDKPISSSFMIIFIIVLAVLLVVALLAVAIWWFYFHRGSHKKKHSTKDAYSVGSKAPKGSFVQNPSGRSQNDPISMQQAMPSRAASTTNSSQQSKITAKPSVENDRQGSIGNFGTSGGSIQQVRATSTSRQQSNLSISKQDSFDSRAAKTRVFTDTGPASSNRLNTPVTQEVSHLRKMLV